MSYQGFSSKLHLAQALAKAKSAARTSGQPADKVHQKQLAAKRQEKLLAENMKQRALIETKRGHF